MSGQVRVNIIPLGLNYRGFVFGLRSVVHVSPRSVKFHLFRIESDYLGPGMIRLGVR